MPEGVECSISPDGADAVICFNCAKYPRVQEHEMFKGG